MGKTRNYSELEKQTLLEMVEIEIGVIENKRNDGRMIVKKDVYICNGSIRS